MREYGEFDSDVDYFCFWTKILFLTELIQKIETVC